MKLPQTKSALLTLITLVLFTHISDAYQRNSTLARNEVKIEYIWHASFKISTAEKSILLDPFADKVWIGYNFPEDLEMDAIFSTHPHYDHDGGIFIKKTPYWKDKIPMHNDPGTYQIGNVKVTGIKGKHSDPYGKEFGQKNTIWIVEVAGLKIAHLGDNGPLFPENVAQLQGLDMLMVPIDSRYHILKKEELAVVLNQLKPRVIVPMHYKLEALENRPGKPEDLGPIAPYLTGKSNVTVLRSNSRIFRRSNLPEQTEIVVFRHSPLLNNK